MKLSSVLRPVLLSATGPVCLFLAACEPVDDPNAKPRTWQAPPDPPRRAAPIDPVSDLWLAAWQDLRTRLSPLEARLAALQKIHSESRFDEFLTLDVDTLNVEQLSSLYHFLQRGYFTVERRVLIHLLERRLDRTDSPLAIPSGARRSLKENLANAMHRDEIRMVDLETAIQFYEETGADNFQVPAALSEEETEQLRDAVAGMLDKAAEEIEGMDSKIAELRAKVFPGEVPTAEERAVMNMFPGATGPATPAESAAPADTVAPLLPAPAAPDAAVPDAAVPVNPPESGGPDTVVPPAAPEIMEPESGVPERGELGEGFPDPDKR